MPFDVRIDSLANGAAGIGRLPNGKAVFVEGTAPGDLVRVDIISDKGSFARAELAEIIEASESRVPETCACAGICGGCPWQQVAYPVQMRAKKANIESSLKRIAKLDENRIAQIVDDCVPCKREWGYRNKLELAADRDAAGRLTLGFHKHASDQLVTPAACPLAHKALAHAPAALQGALRYVEGTGDLGIYRVGVRHSLRTKSTEVALWTPPGAFPRAAAAKTLAAALKSVKPTSVVRVMADPGKQRAVKGVEVLSGQGSWHEQLCGIDYRVSAPSFFQVNTAQAETLVETALSGLELDEGSRVADLYCGVGTFTLPLAQTALEVFAVESAASSVRDLRRNADDAGAYIDVIGGDSARELPELGKLDALVVDPPRAGLAEGVPDDIAAASPARLAYVSCDNATWARDVARLESVGYRLSRATPVDLFPQTPHVEVVSIFARA